MNGATPNSLKFNSLVPLPESLRESTVMSFGGLFLSSFLA